MVVLAVLLTSCDKDNSGGTGSEPETTVLDMIQSNSNLQAFEEMITGTDLADLLASAGPLTIFAPGDAALNQLPDGYLESLTTEQHTDILKYHVYMGNYNVINEIKQEAITSAQGDQLFIEIGQSNGNLVNGNARFVTTNIEADNGRIHIIDTLLLPDAYGTVSQNISKRYAYRNFTGRLEAAGLLNTLNTQDDITLLASPDLAIDVLETQLGMALTDEQWSRIMKYHMLDRDVSIYGPTTRMTLTTMSGDSVYLWVGNEKEFQFNNSDFSANVITGTNGAIIAVAGVMLPDPFLDVLTLMGKRLNLKTMRHAFAVARLTGTLYDRNAEFTILVPKDNVPGVNDWPTTEAELAEVLKYYVINEKLMSDDLHDGQTITTWHGDPISVERSGSVITINGTATVTLTDLEARNGVVHVINGTITPPAE